MSALCGDEEGGFVKEYGVNEWHCAGFDFLFVKQVLDIYLADYLLITDFPVNQFAVKSSGNT